MSRRWFLVVMLWLAACGRAPERDDALRREPRRIVTLLPSFTETAFALGQGERIVGIDDYSDYPPEAQRLPKLGGGYDPQLERILSLQPELVLLPKDSKALSALSGNGIAVFAAEPRTLVEVFEVMEHTGQLLGRKTEAQALTARMKRELDVLAASVSHVPKVSVYYELDATPFSVGPDSFIGAMIQKAGGINIVPAELGDFPKLSPELVIAKNPSVIIGATLEQIRARPGWEGIAAVRTGRVSTWSPDEDHLLSRPGPRLPQALRALIRKLHPELSP